MPEPQTAPLVPETAPKTGKNEPAPLDPEIGESEPAPLEKKQVLEPLYTPPALG